VEREVGLVDLQGQAEAARRRPRRPLEEALVHEPALLGEAAEPFLQALEKLREALTLEERSLLALRVDQELSWAETAAVLAREGEAVEPNALMKRFERLKERLGRLAKERGLVD